jgi:hypothetical protein
MACCEEAEVANTNEPSRQDMQQEAAEELVRAHSHVPLLIAVSIILPKKRDLAVGERYKSVVRDGDAMGVASQVVQYVLGSPEWAFGVNDPILAEQAAQKRLKRSGIGQLL